MELNKAYSKLKETPQKIQDREDIYHQRSREHKQHDDHMRQIKLSDSNSARASTGNDAHSFSITPTRRESHETTSDVLVESFLQFLDKNSQRNIQQEQNTEPLNFKQKNILEMPINSLSLDGQIIHAEIDELIKEENFVIEYFMPEPPMFRDCRVASVRDFHQLAHELHNALQPEKSPEYVYRVLYFLLREDEAIKKLDDAFQKKDGRGLETALTERFERGTPQLEYAFHLIGKEDSSTDQTLNRRPQSDEECFHFAERIHHALLQKDGETIYGVLTPFQRNTASLCRFNDSYKKYKQGLKSDLRGLQADMKRYLAGDSLTFSLFLIGDEAMETKVVSLSEAERLSKMALQQTFERNDGARVPVPHKYTTNGCMYRAHILAEALKELGYGVEKAFIYSSRTDEHGQIHAGIVNPDNPEISWIFHTACCIAVKNDLQVETRIIDPSVEPNRTKQLWTVEDWMKWMGRGLGSYEEITLEEWQRKLENQYRLYLRDGELVMETSHDNETYFFITSRNYTSIPSADEIQKISRYKEIPDQSSNAAYNQEGKSMMINATEEIPYYRMDYAIHKEMRGITINNDESAQYFLNDIIEGFRASSNEFHLDTISSTAFRNRFSKSYDGLLTHLQTSGVSLQKIRRFEKFLSGY